MFKRWRERPQRPVKVWAFDVSKQVVGSVLLHAANLVMSMLSSGRLSMKMEDVIEARHEHGGASGDPNPCSFYFLNLLIDVSFESAFHLEVRTNTISRPLLESQYSSSSSISSRASSFSHP